MKGSDKKMLQDCAAFFFSSVKNYCLWNTYFLVIVVPLVVALTSK